MSNLFKILTINPGSTSTKLAIFENKKEKFHTTIRHKTEELKQYETIYNQRHFRTELVEKELAEHNINIDTLDVIAVRGGVLPPCESGVYKVTQDVCDFFKNSPYGEHASNLGAIIGKSLSDKYDVPSFFLDPVVVDELDDIARYSGHPLFERRSIFHALNQKAVAKKISTRLGKKYEDITLIVVHLGGGISVGIHKNARIIDVNNALYGEGSFSPERVGTVPSGQLVDLCFSNKYTKDEIAQILVGQGGIVSYLGTNNMFEVMEKVENGNKEAKNVVDAMCYQIAKEIGALATVTKGKVDAIVLTGGLARDKYIVDNIIDRVKFIAPIELEPGEDELQALALGVLRVLKNEEQAKIIEFT